MPQQSASYYYLDDLQVQQLQTGCCDPVYMEVADDLNHPPRASSGKSAHLAHEDSGFTEEGSDIASSAGSRGNKREGLTTKKRMK